MRAVFTSHQFSKFCCDFFPRFSSCKDANFHRRQRSSDYDVSCFVISNQKPIKPAVTEGAREMWKIASTPVLPPACSTQLVQSIRPVIWRMPPYKEDRSSVHPELAQLPQGLHIRGERKSREWFALRGFLHRSTPMFLRQRLLLFGCGLTKIHPSPHPCCGWLVESTQP